MKDNPPALALELVQQAPTAAPNQPSSRQRIELILAAAKAPVTQRQLRNAARMRASHVADILAQMIESGRVSRSNEGYQLKS